MANATISTFTAIPCGQAPLPSYEVPVADAALVPLGNLAAVKIADNPSRWTCCAINRDTINDTPRANVYQCQDSGYTLAQCAACNAAW